HTLYLASSRIFRPLPRKAKVLFLFCGRSRSQYYSDGCHCKRMENRNKLQTSLDDTAMILQTVLSHKLYILYLVTCLQPPCNLYLYCITNVYVYATLVYSFQI